MCLQSKVLSVSNGSADFLDTKFLLFGVAGEASDAVSGKTQAKMIGRSQIV